MGGLNAVPYRPLAAQTHHCTLASLFPKLQRPQCTPFASGHADGNSGVYPLWCKKKKKKKKKVPGKMHEEEEDGGGGGGEANPPSPLQSAASKPMDVADADPHARLCGHLTKLAGKGPLRGFKPRWFVYDPRKCYLYYFKTAQDALPLGHIEIGDACFSYDVEGDEGQFEIHTAGKEFLLKVCDS